MRSVWIVDAQAVAALGQTRGELWRRVREGETGIGTVSRFRTGGYASGVAACVEPPSGDGGEAGELMSLLRQALRPLGPVPADAHLLTATTKGEIGGVETALREGRAAPPGTAIPDWVAAVARETGLSAAGARNVSAACASSTIALARAAALIALGRTEAVLVCCADRVSEFVFSGFSCLKALSPGPCRPFDRDRAGLTLGEGAAVLLLMSGERAAREGRVPLGTVLGWGVANDAFHVTAPAPDGRGLLRACRAALARAELPADGVGAVSAHGTGTVYNDAMELAAFRALFGARAVPMYSVKGALGHCLGAAGGLEAVLALEALGEGAVPPTAGFENPAPGAEERVRGVSVPFAGEALLSTNSGFGGVNAALVLGRGAR